MQTIALFGTFDGIHEGHRSCFSQAKAVADHVVAIVAPDAIVERLKGRPPRHSIRERIEALQEEPLVDEVVVGDQTLDTYDVLSLLRPNLVALGYDQLALSESVRSWANQHAPEIRFVRLESFQPDTFKSSLL